MRNKARAVAFAFTAAAGLAVAIPAHTQSAGVQAGVLSCNVAGGWGFVFASSRQLNCTFSGASPDTAQRYIGDITKFGVDAGYSGSAVIVWAVFAPTTNLAPGSLAGNYAGATGSAAAGPGAGANVLVGGSNQSVSLQPVSIQGGSGLNVAAGIAAMSLQPAGH